MMPLAKFCCHHNRPLTLGSIALWLLLLLHEAAVAC